MPRLPAHSRIGLLTSGSIWPAVLLHLLHNGVTLVMQAWVAPTTAASPWWAALLVVSAAGILLLVRLARDGTNR